MEDEAYGIEKEHSHARAQELIPEEFFWDCADELAPFGSDEGDTALAEWRGWRKRNSAAPLMGCLVWTIESVGEIAFADYNESLLSRDLVQQQVADAEFDDQQYVYTLDVSVIATAFGQLVDEGKIDQDAKPIAKLALERQTIWAELQPGWAHAPRYVENLKILGRALERA